MATLNSFPNNADEYIGAEEVMHWLHGRTKGVYAGAGNAAITAVGGVMQVSVAPGIGWMTDAGGEGICWWFDSTQVVDIDAAEGTGTLDRIDRVIIQWRTVDYADKPELVVLKGTDSSSAVAPALTNNSTLRQISLAKISIPAGTTELTALNIIDERSDPDVCGIVTETVTVDTTTINAQFQAFLAAIEEELQELEADSGVELKKKQFNNVTVATSAFIEQQTPDYEDFPYCAEVALTGVIATDIPEVVFSIPDASSGMFAPGGDSYNGGVKIYANDVPEAAITIPVIYLWRGNAT